MKFHPSSVCEQSPGQQSVSELFCGIGQFSYFFVSQTHYAMQMESNCGGGGMSKYGSLDVLHIFYVRPQTRVRHQQRAQWCVCVHLQHTVGETSTTEGALGSRLFHLFSAAAAVQQ